MASSQLKSENSAQEGVAGGFPFAWRSPAISGSETVVTNSRPDPSSSQVPPSDKKELQPDLIRRLFPTGSDTDDALGIRLGHFTIQRRIGIGGMGSVFLAMDERLRRNVALKVLSPLITSDPAAVQRFQNEAIAAARLDHDNIARIFFYGEDCGLHYIAYEFIPGMNLRDVIRAKERLAPAEAVNYTMQLAAALSHTAAAGVIHRDIKPSNVLITPMGRAKLVDLGLARKETADQSVELTVAGTTLGTFDYISPEQAKDPRSVDVRSDIYSLGCTLYHMLTGEPPYPEGTVLQKLLDHQGKEAPDPARKNRRVPPALSMIVRKMMESDPRRRYSTPAKLLSDLLQVARQLGSGAVPIDGQVWLTATNSENSQWQGNVGWIATGAALLIVVIAMQQFPTLTQRLEPRKPSIITSTNSAVVPPSAGNSVTSSATISVPKGTSGAKTSLDQEPWPAATPQIGVNQPETSRLFPETSLENVLDRVPPLVPPFSNDGDFAVNQHPAMKLTPATPLEMPQNTSDVVSESSLTTRPLPGSGTGIINTPAVQPEPRNVISIVGGKSYPTLEAACSEAKDDSIIELRYDGRRGAPERTERPFRLSKERVIIRGGSGFRPIIEFAPGELQTDASQPQMVTVTGGSLEVIDIDLRLVIPESVTADRWAMFKLENPKNLQLRNVTVTIENRSLQPTCVFEQVKAPGQGVGNMGMKKNGSSLAPPLVSATKSVFRGHCDLITLRDAVPVHYKFEEVAVALHGVLLRTICPMEVNAAEGDRVSIDLDHLTCLTSEGLIDNQTEHAPPLIIEARNNVIWCASDRPLVTMADFGDLMEMQRRFTWIGDRNHYEVAIFLQAGGRHGLGSARQLDFNAWRNHVGSNEGTGSTNSSILWDSGKPYDRVGASIELPQMELDPGSSSRADGRGATLKYLPVPPKRDTEIYETQ